MTIILASFLVILILSMLWFIGNGIQIFALGKSNIYLSSPLGFIISGLFIINAYVFFQLSIFTIFVLFLVFFLLLFIYSILQKNTFNHYIKVLIIYLPLLFLFILSLILFDENFYAFRGNVWDQFANIALALTYEKINYNEISALLNKEKFTQIAFEELIKKNNLSQIYYTLSFPHILARPGPPIFTSVIFQFKFLDIYLISYVLKTIYLILSYLSFIFFLREINFNLKFSLKIFFVSLIFTLSFWTLYIFEADAISQLFAYSASIIFFSYLIKIFFQNNKYKIEDLIILSLSFSFIFLFYEAQAVVFALLLLLIFFIKLDTCIKNFRILVPAILLFIILTFPRLYQSMSLAYNFSNVTIDFWAYFGSFILGRENVILDSIYVDKIKNLLDGNNSYFFVFKKIIDFNYAEKYFFILFNIFPSFLGFYFITPGALHYDYSILLTVILFILSCYVLIPFYQNLKNIIFGKYNYLNFFKIIIIFYLGLSLLLFFKNNFYGLVKIYFYFSPIWFILIFFRFNNKQKHFIARVNVFLLLIMSTFFIYKFSQYNFGIGRVDSFPSTLKKELKISQNWSLKKIPFTNCLIIHLNIKDYLQNVYVSMYLDSKNINYVNNFYKSNTSDNARKCSLEINKGNFFLVN
jgi:hypothetical protein